MSIQSVEMADAIKEVFSAVLLLPFLWYFVRENTRNQEKMHKLFSEALNKQERTINNGFKNLEMSIGKHVILETSQVIEIATTYVTSTSYLKLKFIRQRLEKNSIEDRKERVKSSIWAELERLSIQHYIKPLNNHNTRVGLLGTWIGKNFPMKDFMDEVFDVIFSKSEIDKKINDIETIMQCYQTELWKQLEEELNK